MKTLTVSGNAIYNNPGFPGQATQAVGIRFRQSPDRRDMSDSVRGVFVSGNELWPLGGTPPTGRGVCKDTLVNVLDTTVPTALPIILDICPSPQQ